MQHNFSHINFVIASRPRHSVHFLSNVRGGDRAREPFRKMKLGKTLPTWEDCFDYVIGVSEAFALPPFSSRTKRNRFKFGWWMLLQVFMLLRLVMTLIFESGTFFIICVLLCYVLDTCIKLVHLKLTEDNFRDYFRDIDDFLRKYELTLRLNQSKSFFGIWAKERPRKLVRISFGVAIATAVAWGVNTVYGAVASPEVPHPLYWSPFFEISKTIKYSYTLLDIVPAFPFTIFPWYLNVVFMSLAKFQHTQLIYVREMAAVVFGVGLDRQTKENVVFWVRIHQEALRSKDKVNDLLGIQALSSYFFLTLCAVFTIVVSLFKNTTHDDNQKLITLIFLVLLILQFSYNCILMDRWEDEEIAIRKIVFSEELFKADKWQLSAYKMYMNRLNKPLKFVGFHHVTMNSGTLRAMFTNTYSLYTSLVSVIRHKTI